MSQSAAIRAALDAGNWFRADTSKEFRASRLGCLAAIRAAFFICGDRFSREGNMAYEMKGQGTADLATFTGLKSAYHAGRAARWLEARIKRGQREVFSEVVELTPELAGLLLDRNDHNRRVDENAVAAYQTDIEEDRYQLNGESIIVSNTGELNDGQHRCHAVIRAQKPINTIMVFGVERETRTTIDEGKARTPGDYLSMDGVSDSNNIAAAAARLYEISKYGRTVTGRDQKPTKQQVLEFAADNSDALQRSLRACRQHGSGRIASLSLLTTAHYCFARIDEARADLFINKLISGAELKPRDPIFVAREKMLTPGLRLNNNEKLKTLFTAWNHHRAGTTVKTIVHSFKRGETLPGLR